MTITVETGGPIGTTLSVVSPGASTFADLMLQIADEIDDTTGEYAGPIQNACFQAIRWCEREVYYFNETRDITFPTVSGQEWYDASDNAQIPTLVRIQEVYSERTDGSRTRLNRTTPVEIEILADNAASRGEPYSWTYFGQRLRIYPIPDLSTYTIRLQLGPYRLATITDSSESNAWTTEAFDMVKARAKYIVYKDVLKDAALAAEALNDYMEQHLALKAETSRRNATGCIQVTCF